VIVPGARVPGFLPSTGGFRFPNAFAPGPVLTLRLPLWGDVPLGDASGGMCGGMAFGAADLFLAGLAPPPDAEAPRPGTPLFRWLARRLLASFGGPRGVLRYLRGMAASDAEGARRAAAEWPRVKADLDAGRPCPLGLIKAHSHSPLRLGENHQVLAWGYDANGSAVTLHIYDPNEPLDDGVTLAFDAGGREPIVYSADPAARGFFRSRYAPARPDF